MIKVELIKNDSEQDALVQVETVEVRSIKLSLGLKESEMLDAIIEKVLVEPYGVLEEFIIETDERIFLMNLAAKIGNSGIREYIK